MDLVRKKHARMNYLDYRATASFIIGMFKTVFINSDGLISRINPPSNRTIFDNFDDIAPFFLFFDEEKFLIDQTINKVIVIPNRLINIVVSK